MTSLRVLGFASLLVSAFVPLGAACTCGPDPSGPPPQETCEEGGLHRGVTSVTVTSVREVFGAQGGMHTEIRFSAVGEVLPTCAAYGLYVGETRVSSGTIRGTVTGTSFSSRAIIYLGPGLGAPESVSVEAFGLRSPRFGAPADAGPDDAPAADAGSDAPAEIDAPTETDAGEADAAETDAAEADAG